jgi:glycine oxidase
MNALSRASVIVAGAGAFGSACALALARKGAQVTLIDPAGLAANASGMAAGMIAPAFESALDPVSAGQFGLMADARDLWPAFVEGLGPTGLVRSGALLRGPDAFKAGVWAKLEAEGARQEEVGGDLFTPEDWRIEPRLALAAMRQGLIQLGGEVRAGQIAAVGKGQVRLGDGVILSADAVILACGFGGQGLVPELDVLTPIKGQLLRFPEAEPQEGPILRGPSGYLAPGMAGPVVGATMEAGRRDLVIDPEATHRLMAEAVRLLPALAAVRAQPFTGIRAATPDGLPLIGSSVIDGVWLAAGARRNGWLFAPLAAEILAAQIMGERHEDGGLGAAAFTPSRFVLSLG